MEDARAAFASIPPVTRYLLVSFLAITLPALGGALDLRKFGFFLPAITKKYELWRLLTSYLYAGKGINLLFDLFLFHRTSVALEVDTHLGDTAAYAWSLAFLAVGIQTFNLYLQNWFLFRVSLQFSLFLPPSSSLSLSLLRQSKLT
ncbi:hypothetical protein BDY24DRAFT_383348 [Mrakia frigida]|uniref:uncharacterized protein n=1 Tax=Mrakia frigida TaxID=29902 RepID=UPI003FCC1874